MILEVAALDVRAGEGAAFEVRLPQRASPFPTVRHVEAVDGVPSL